MDIKTILHIGQHKTATTSIQKFLKDYHQQLIKYGFYFPIKFFNNIVFNHTILTVLAMDKNRFFLNKETIYNSIVDYNQLYNFQLTIQKNIDKIYYEAQNYNCHTVIWSSESLYFLNSLNEYLTIKNLFKQYSSVVEIICCFRDKISFKASYIEQLIKQKSSLINNNKDSYRYIEEDSWLLDYERKKNLLLNVFDRCIFFDYNKYDNVQNFLNHIDCPITTNTLAYRLNESIKKC